MMSRIIWLPPISALYPAHLRLTHDDAANQGIVTRLLFRFIHKTAIYSNLHFFLPPYLRFLTVRPLGRRSVIFMFMPHLNVIIIIIEALLGAERCTIPFILASLHLKIILLEDRLPLELVSASITAKASASR